MHLSYEEIPVARPTYTNDYINYDGTDIDEKFFYSVPTSFFTLDENIPKIIRELFAEAEGCLQGNFLTGASACLRKIIYELARKEGAQGDNYEDRIKSLKSIKPSVDPTYFDTLLAIQKATSDKVHENSYDKWESKHLRLLLATVREVLHEIYVLPKVKEQRRTSVLELSKLILGKKKANDSEPPEPQSE